MWDFLSELVTRTFTEFGERLMAFGPNLLAMILILALGLALAGAVRYAARFLLPRVGFDRLAQQSGLTSLLSVGPRSASPSNVVALVLAWTVLGIALLLALSALNLQIAMEFVSRAFTYVPNVLVAVAILVLGSFLAAFVRRSVLIAAVNAGLPFARLLAGGVRTALMILFAAMALEHLGVGRQTLLISFAIVFGGIVLALALAFGLAGRDLARETLERLVRRASDDAKDELKHL